MRLWLGAYEWRTAPGETGWLAPEGARSLLDLRTLTEQGQQGGVPALRVLFSTDDTTTIDGAIQIASDPDETLTGTRLTAVQTVLGLPTLDHARLSEALFEALTYRADLTDQRCCPSLLARHDGLLELLIGPRRIVEALDFASPTWTVLQQRYYAQYRAARRTDRHRQTLTVWCEQFRLDVSSEASWSRFIPPDLPHEPPLPHTTTLAETFDTADSATLGPTYAWTEYKNNTVFDGFAVASNTCAAKDANDDHARAEADVSTVNHEAMITITALGTGAENKKFGPAVRFSSADSTSYFSRARQNTDTIEVMKNLAGVITAIGSGVAITISLPQAATLRVDGSTLTASYAGTQTHSFTDTAISAGTRGGLYGYNDTADSTTSRADNWSLTDVTTQATATATTTRARPFPYRPGASRTQTPRR